MSIEDVVRRERKRDREKDGTVESRRIPAEESRQECEGFESLVFKSLIKGLYVRKVSLEKRIKRRN